jgi:hypothetical protein
MSKTKSARAISAARMAAGARRLRSIGMALALGFSVNLSMGVAVAQQDPTSIGTGQKPMVIILMDTSASMEFTTAGNERYPRREANTGDDLKEWKAGELLNDGYRLYGNELQGAPDRKRPEQRGPQLIGSCYVWEPVCSDYERPPWYPEKELMPRNKGGTDAMMVRLNSMRGSIPLTLVGGLITLGSSSNLVRLKDNSQPRHVQVKEILTGDMILAPDLSIGLGINLPSEQLYGALNPQEHGPGCWFVPRMSGANINKDASNICKDPGSGNFSGSADSQSFNDFVDYLDPRPHFQEVHDRQLPTGLMDNLAGTVIFAVAMFDGVSGEYDSATNRVKSSTHQLNDGMDHADNIVMAGPFTNGAPQRTKLGGGNEAPLSEASDRYNLGVYKIIGPATLEIGALPTLLPSLSRMTQLALVDSGYLRNGENKKEWRVEPGKNDNKINYTIPKELEDYIVPFEMGRQPIAMATPLAGAMRDLHKFFVAGQKAFKKDGSVSPAANKVYDPANDPSVKVKDIDKDNMIHSPIATDPYQYCRAKHVVMMTDGFPQPEWGDGLGADQLNESYGYENLGELYPYATAETEISALVNDQRINPPMVNGLAVHPKFKSRVHIVGLNVGDATTQAASHCDATNNSENCRVRRKLGQMAAAGGTCAYYYLCSPSSVTGECTGDGAKYIPTTWSPKGTCDPVSGNCLVQQLVATDANYQFQPPIDGATLFNCSAPALLLQRNDSTNATAVASGGTARDDLTQALQFVMNEVINASGGIASRTRASVTNTLDQYAGNLPKTGQYRFYSGVNVGGSVYWQGLLSRQELACAGNGGVNTAASDNGSVDSRPIHEDIAAQVQVDTNGVFTDNRRIFSIKPLLDSSQHLVPPSNTDSNLFPISFELVRLADTADEFMPPSPDPLPNKSYLRGSRIPFRVEALIGATDPTVIGALNGLLGNLLGTVDALLSAVLGSVFGTSDIEEVIEIVDNMRGNAAEKRGRTLNAILNSNPVTVGPPELDIPIESYRAFRARYANRPTMLYVSTLDGQLHAIHAGEMNGGQAKVRVRTFIPVTGNSQGAEVQEGEVTPGVVDKTLDPVPANTPNQREAWAYIPHMLLNKIGQSKDRQPNLMDGTPVISDVRLCDGRANLNQNVQACQAFGKTGSLNPEDQWRTVLVQGLGASGAGYFAIDITRSGGPTGVGNTVVSPDPIPLWEFSPIWEAQQLDLLAAAGKQKRYSPEASNLALPIDPETGMAPDTSCLTMTRPIDKYSFMGLSVSEPAIGTVSLHSSIINAAIQRPVAVFSAGIKGDVAESDPCVLNVRQGRALYIVDLQTGSLLRRFVSYRDSTGAEKRFDSEVSGAPALFDTTPGTVSSRGYVGDSKGRLFRLNLNKDRNGDNRLDPEDWTLDLMFDPNDTVQGATLRAQVASQVPGLVTGSDPINFGPASFKPAVALDASRQIVVIYGLGERGETSTAGQAQAVVALREKFNGGNLDLTADSVLWTHALGEAEKLTGEPIIFNSGVYFTSFKENPSNRCEPGKSRIWGVDFLGAFGTDGTPLKRIRGIMPLVLPDGTDIRMLMSGSGEDGILYEEDGGNSGNAFWIGPAAPSLIRGVAITLGPICSVALDPTGTSQSFDGSQDPQPQLIAQTGGATPGNAAAGGRVDPSSGINRMVIPLKRPRTQTIPLSWANLGI